MRSLILHSFCISAVLFFNAAISARNTSMRPVGGPSTGAPVLCGDIHFFDPPSDGDVPDPVTTGLTGIDPGVLPAMSDTLRDGDCPGCWARSESSCLRSLLTIYSCSCSNAFSISTFSFCSYIYNARVNLHSFQHG